jgi:RND family efflux transporter MFP subunit
MPESGEDLSKLKIEKARAAPASKLKKRKTFYRAAYIIAGLVALFMVLKILLGGARQVEISTVGLMYPSQALTELNASGYVVAERKAAVSSKVTGTLVSINVEEGSRVKEGQIIAALENQDVMAERARMEANLNAAKSNLEQARAAFAEAKISYERSKTLLSKGYISQSDFDTAEARYKSDLASVSAREADIKAAEAAVREARASVGYTYLRAPFDGVILTKDADVGDIITPIGAAAEAKAAVVTMADMKSLQVEVDVAESNINLVKMGQPAEIRLDAFPDVRFPARVHMIVPTADRTKATVLVKVRFIKKDPRILPEMSAKVAFLSRPVTPEEEKPRLVMDRRALLQEDGKNYAFKVVNGKAEKVPVQTGEALGETLTVQAGLKEGDKVVLNPGKLREGQKVEAAKT